MVHIIIMPNTDENILFCIFHSVDIVQDENCNHNVGSNKFNLFSSPELKAHKVSL